MEQTQVETQTIEPQQPVAQPELTVTDLQNIRSLIETVVRRGAFQAQELSSVGAVYDKLNNFLNALATPKAEG